ncbi:htrB [Acinetobacter baumannii]|nr:htrB [Acinetobacter baumannii]
MYRPQNNPLLDMLIYRCRGTIYKAQIDHDDMRGLIRHLKEGDAIWYSPDQDFGLKQGIMAPFFGVPAATLTADLRVNKIIENQLRIAPTQYMWFHRRFKTRPEGYEEIY